MVGEWPPRSNKTATSARSWWVMIWAGILGSEMEGPFRVSGGIKMTFARYVEQPLSRVSIDLANYFV